MPAKLSFDTGALESSEPVAEDTGPFTVRFHGGAKFPLGAPDTVKVAFAADAGVQLVPIFPAAAGSLKECGLGDFFADEDNEDKFVLCFNAGAYGALAASGAFSYSALTANVTVSAGANGGYAYFRAFDTSLPVEEVLSRFFDTMCLPEQAKRAPERGEAIALRYGGYLKLCAGASAGYELTGTKSLSAGGMALSEKYGLSIIGKVGLTAGIAGQFSILVTAADGMPDWARVRVHRHGTSDFRAAADVNAGFNSEMDGLPENANEFLGAALGVNAKNFVNLFEKARELSDFAQLEKSIDTLAKKYIAEYTGKAFDALAAPPEFAIFLDCINQVAASYKRVGDRSVTLFERYFDRTAELEKLLESKELNGSVFWQLTDGDPLGTDPKELRARADAALSLIRGEAHAAIRKVVAIARESFPVGGFFEELAKIDSPDELKALANEKAGAFVTRLLGEPLDASTNYADALKRVKAVLDKTGSFRDQLYGAMKSALCSSYKMALHAEYSRASESDALIDVLINMSRPEGAGLMRAAGRGDFECILAHSDAGLVRLCEGVLTHRTRRESAFKIHIADWHLNYNYEGFDRVITEAEQRLAPSDRGIQIFATESLNVGTMRKRAGEEMHVNFLLRALGESAKAVKSDRKTADYVIDVLTSLTASYQVSFSDSATSFSELRDYLAFAAELGLDKQGATAEALEPLLPRAPDGGYGPIDASYEVRFGKNAVQALLRVKKLTPEAERAVRKTMRQTLLANYLRGDALHNVAFAYAMDGVFRLYMKEGHAQFVNHSRRQFGECVLVHTELIHLTTLYNIENSLIKAINALYEALSSGPLDPREFEKRLEKFGKKLQEFDKFDQTTDKHGIGVNTIFAMFDTLVRLAPGGESANSSMLRLTSQANGTTVEKLFFRPPANEPAILNEAHEALTNREG